MRARLVEAVVMTALVVGAIATNVFRATWWIGYGTVVLAIVALIAWLSLAASGIRRMRGREQAPPGLHALEVVANIDPGMYMMGAFFGAFAAVTSLLLVDHRSQPVPPLGFIALPLVFGFLTVMMFGWRQGITLDGPTRQLRRWSRVRVGPRTYGFGLRSSTVATDATVVMYRATGGWRIDVGGNMLEPLRDENRARLAAELIAKALGCDLIDQTANDGEVRRRPLADLDLPLAVQLQRRGETATRRPLPARTNFVLESEELPWVVRIAPRGLTAGDVFSMVFVLPFMTLVAFIPGAFILAIAMDRITTGTLVPLAVLIAVAVCWYTVWRPLLRQRLETQRIQLSSSGIRISRRSPGWHAQGDLPAEVIEEIVVEPNGQGDAVIVVARGDGVRLEFGHHLGRDDAKWLRDAAIAALAPRSIYR